MNILYLIDELVCRGGTERHLYDLASAMVNLGHSVLIVCLQEGIFAEEFKKNPNLDYRCLNVKRIYDFRGLAGLYRLICWLGQAEIDILQTFHSGSDLLGPLAALWSKVRPVVISSRRDLGFTKNRRQLWAQKFLNKHVDLILANSNAVKQVAVEKEKITLEKIAIIYNGINHQKMILDLTKVKEWQNKFSLDGCTVIGSVGNIRPVKGYIDLMESSVDIIQRCPSARFLIAGGGVTPEIRSHIRMLGLENYFYFLGNISELDIPSFLHLLDIYVQPSHSEGFSNAILEAMAFKLPVVITDVGGNREAVTHGIEGLLVPPKNPSELAKAIMALAVDPACREQFGENGRARVVKDFTYESMLDQYCEIYHKIVRSR